jgi:hypothetical protein
MSNFEQYLKHQQPRVTVHPETGSILVREDVFRWYLGITLAVCAALLFLAIYLAVT